MECFVHPENPAVGICKSCGKAVCRSCAQDLGFALVCSATCSAEATDLNEMNRRAKRIYGVGVVHRKLPSSVIVWALFALFLVGFGVYNSFLKHQPEWFLLILGGLFAIIACMTYRRTKDTGLQC